MEYVMKYNFDEVVERRGTGCLKYDFAKERGKKEDVLPLWVADMDFKTAPAVTERLQKVVEHGIYGYSDSKEDYFAAVSGWYHDHFDWDVKPEWLVKTPGVVFALAAAVRAYTEKGDTVLIQQPVYYPFRQVIESNDRKLVSSDLVLKDGHYEIDFEDFERNAADPHTKLFILCNPQNPTSRVFTREELERMGDICMKHHVFVCSDEIHGDLIMPGHVHIPFASIKQEFADHSMTCTAASKTFNLAGFQTSAIIIKDPEIRAAFLKHQKTTEINPKCNILGYEATRLAYTFGEEWYQEMLSVIETNYKLITDFCRKELPKIQIINLEGTYLLWMDFRKYGIEGKELAELLKSKANLFFDDGYIFGSEGEGFERWNLAAPTRLVEAGLKRLKDTMESL